MSAPDPAGRDAGRGFVRAIGTLTCLGGAVLAIALVTAMGRWMIG